MDNKFKNFQSSVIDDTTHLRTPVVGDRYTSWLDTVEVIEVSEPLTHNGKTDVGLRLRVVEVHSPDEGSEVGGIYELLFGDLIFDEVRRPQGTSNP
jgi:hypothetical protein